MSYEIVQPAVSDEATMTAPCDAASIGNRRHRLEVGRE